jgi:catechol 2,3-dioxygenase
VSVGISPPGFRLPAPTHVGSVRLQVADLDRSIAFYRDVVGFTAVARTSGGARLSARAGEPVLLELDEQPGVRPVPRRGLLGVYHFAVLLPTRPALGAFVRHLADVPMQIGMADHSYSQSIYLYDPDGLGVEVYADQPRETWVVRNGEYVGTVDPLDVPALVSIADPAPWPGLPAGTTIGHVHLYVGDLAEADAFYHAGLGFDRVGSFQGALFVSAGGYHHHVGLNTWAAGAPVAGDDDARLLEWRLVVPDRHTVDDLARHLAEAGIEIERDGDSLLARDPWNIAVTVKSAD